MVAGPRSRDRIDPETVHEVLRNDRRRRTLEYLRERLEPVSVRELSESIAGIEASISPTPRDLRQSVYNSLHQTHLPKLDDFDIVDYDKDRKMVALEERAKDIYVYMGIATPFGLTWATFYRSFGVGTLVLIVLAEVGAPALSALDPLLIATVSLFGFAFSTAYQLWTRRWLYVRSILDLL
jgi:hypothetical protein